ncbi:sensor histidine kinase [Paracoccus tibetensis]|uniref:histidine kinase n=1 Tax=Paracoccus tibetensis TaxID=336292 RepID=A0A1G5DL61_9RHOB|nr:PAS domain-containing sensor histidine kinase [Paracoccus tibetensis]SCY15445.1 PAS domain S-box-containing protein [Paracoccus tibetensis]
MNTLWPGLDLPKVVEFSWETSRMARAIAAHDWAATPLGPIDGWPVSLVSAVKGMLYQPHPSSMFWGPDLTMLYNDAYAPILGAKEEGALGRPLALVWSDVWEDVKPLVRRTLSGEGTLSHEMRLIMRRNGYDEETFFTFTYSPLFDDLGRVAGFVNLTMDVTEHVESRRAQQVMQAELLHRIRNILTVTSTVVSATLRNASSLPEARDRVAARIMALSKAQGLMTELGDRAEIGDVARQSISAHIDDWSRVDLSGPQLALSSQQAVGLSLALYELATNAAKYGALSQSGGRISINWQHDLSGRFRFAWAESGGPQVAPTARRSGFGSQLTNLIVPAYFEGHGATRYAPEGLQYRLEGQLAG